MSSAGIRLPMRWQARWQVEEFRQRDTRFCAFAMGLRARTGFWKQEAQQFSVRFESLSGYDALPSFQPEVLLKAGSGELYRPSRRS